MLGARNKKAGRSPLFCPDVAGLLFGASLLFCISPLVIFVTLKFFAIDFISRCENAHRQGRKRSSDHSNKNFTHKIS